MSLVEPAPTPADRLVLRALQARGGSATPGVLRDATGLSARTVSRALSRLEHAGLLGQRSKGRVTLAQGRASSSDATAERQGRGAPGGVRGAPLTPRPSRRPRAGRPRARPGIVYWGQYPGYEQPAPTADERTAAAEARRETPGAAENNGMRLSPFLRGLLGGGGF